MPLKLHVIEGTPPPDTVKERVRANRRADPNPAGVLQCRRCGSREMIEVRSGATLRNGRLSGGTVQILCASCYAKGDRAIVA